MATLFDGAIFDVSVAFSKGAGDVVVDGDYTNISQWVRGVVQINRGRSTERDTFQAGSCTVDLFNEANRFDPDNASSPYAGNLQPMKQIRVRVTYAGGTSYLFKGWVQGWPRTWQPGSADGTVQIIANDFYKLAAKCALPESIYSAEVLADTPTAWWRLGDTAGNATVKDYSGNGNDAQYDGLGGSTTASGVIFASSNGARKMPGTIGAVNPPIMQIPVGVTTTAWTFEFWITPPSTIAGTNYVYQSTNLVVNFNFFSAGNWRLIVAVTDSGGSVRNQQYGLNATTTPAIGSTIHVAIVKSGTTFTVYLNGVSNSPTTSSGGLALSTMGTDIKRWVGFGPDIGIVIDEVAVYPSALSAGRVLAHYTAGLNGWAGDTVDARITRVLATTRYSAFTTSLNASTQTVQGCDFGSGTVRLLDYLTTLWQTEGGSQARIFAAADGTITFHSRYHDTANSTTVAAFTDILGSTLPYTDLGSPKYDDTRVINAVVATRNNGFPQTATDSTSDLAEGTSALSISGLLNQNDAEVLDRANAVVYQYKSPYTRIEYLTYTPGVSATSTLIPIARTTDIGARVSVRKLPQFQGSAWTKNLVVEGITHTIDTSGNWTTQYLTASYDAAATWSLWDTAIWDTNVWSY